jgi:hypothetical protein
MNIIKMRAIILVVVDRMFPEQSLPNSSLALSLNGVIEAQSRRSAWCSTGLQVRTAAYRGTWLKAAHPPFK